jgi:hypothetical protein
VEKLVLWGDADRIAAELRGYALAGVEHAVIFNVTGMGWPPAGTVRASYEVLNAVRADLARLGS